MRRGLFPRDERPRPDRSRRGRQQPAGEQVDREHSGQDQGVIKECGADRRATHQSQFVHPANHAFRKSKMSCTSTVLFSLKSPGLTSCPGSGAANQALMKSKTSCTLRTPDALKSPGQEICPL